MPFAGLIGPVFPSGFSVLHRHLFRTVIFSCFTSPRSRSHGSCRIVPQGLVVRFGLSLDALCKIKSHQKNVQPASFPGQPRASHHTSLPSLLQPPSFRRSRQPTSPIHHHNALQRSPTPRAALQATEKFMVNPFRLFTAPSTESFWVASSVVYTPSPSPSSPNTPSEDSSRRLPAGPQPSSSFRGAAAAGICVQLVWSAASSGLPASPTSCSRPIRPVTSVPRPFTPHQPARPAASAVCRAQWMRMPAGALGRHPGSRAIRTAGLSWPNPSIGPGRPLPRGGSTAAAVWGRRACRCRHPGGRCPTQPSATFDHLPHLRLRHACDHVAIRCARRRRRRAHS